jgi:hypothetical protein
MATSNSSGQKDLGGYFGAPKMIFTVEWTPHGRYKVSRRHDDN